MSRLTLFSFVILSPPPRRAPPTRTASRGHWSGDSKVGGFYTLTCHPGAFIWGGIPVALFSQPSPALSYQTRLCILASLHVFPAAATAVYCSRPTLRCAHADAQRSGHSLWADTFPALAAQPSLASLRPGRSRRGPPTRASPRRLPPVAKNT